jgi:putative ABC transport system permease protein
MADRLVMLYERQLDGSPSFVGYSTYTDLRRGSRSLQSAAAVGDWQPTLFGDRDAERMQGQRVSWQYFATLGVRPALGRDFIATDDTPASNNVVILSHGLWTRRFGADPGIVGGTVDVDGVMRSVVGVMPASFDNVTSPTAQLWRVLGYAESDAWGCRTCRHLQVVARLRDGVTQQQAAREIDALSQRLAVTYPKEYAGHGALLVGLQERVTRKARPIFLAILGAVVLVLLIAAANVVNLQLARAVRRQGEFAVRAALGAGRGRLAQQLLAESLVLAALGGVIGLLIAAALLPALVAQLPESLPRQGAIRIDWLSFTLVAFLVLLLGVLMGMAPALYAGRRRLFDALRGGGRTVGGAHHRTRAGIVIGEIALAMMLLIGAGLLGRSLVVLLSVNVGFDPTQLVTMEVQATGTAYQTPAAVFANHDRILDAVRAVPGVVDAGLSNQLPLGGSFDMYGIRAQDKPLENPELAPSADRYTVTSDLMRTMRIPVIRGRGFTDTESRDSSVKVAIVSEALAKRIWPGEDAVGKYIKLGGPQRPWWLVIGIAGNIHHQGLDVGLTQQVYTPERQWFWEESQMTLVVRTKGDPAHMLSAVRDAVRGVDPLQPISRVATMDEVISRSTSQRRLGLLLFVAFGAMALLLATAGIYGVLAGSVAERTREFGVRTALGASPRSIVALVLRQGAVLAGIGLVIGTIAAFGLSRYLRALLFGVESTDPIAIGCGVLGIIGVSLVACLVPARRAVRVDPMTALRSD